MGISVHFDIEGFCTRFDARPNGRGDHLRFNCPMCSDTRGRFYVRITDVPGHLRGYCCCFNCGFRSRSFPHFVSSVTGLTLYQAFNRVAFPQHTSPRSAWLEFMRSMGLMGYEPDKEETEAVDDDASITMPPYFLPVRKPGDPVYRKSPFARRATDFLIGRGLTWDDIRKYDIRYCIRGDSPFFNHVIFPITEFGRLRYWTGRRFLPDDPRYNKCEHPSRSEVGIGKSEVLFNLDGAALHDTIVLVEGPLDAIAVGECAVALMGKTISDVQLGKLVSLRPNRITVILDDDAVDEALCICNQLRGLVDDVGYVNPGMLGFHDPSDMGRELCQKVLRNVKTITSLDEVFWRFHQLGRR